MKYPKTRAVVILAAIAVVTTAISPSTARMAFLVVPVGFARMAKITSGYLEWRDLQERARQGDVEAMYRVGLILGGEPHLRPYRPPVDEELGEGMVRRAAALGYVPAQLHESELDQGSAEDLYRLLPERWDTDWYLRVNLQDTALKACHGPLFLRALAIHHEYMSRWVREGHPSVEGYNESYREEENRIEKARFEDQCGFLPEGAPEQTVDSQQLGIPTTSDT